MYAFLTKERERIEVEVVMPVLLIRNKDKEYLKKNNGEH